MRIIALQGPKQTYSCTSYLVLGDMNRLDDVNALIDVGTDGSIINELATISTGVGKKPVQRVVITHSHFDHCGGIGAIREAYSPECLGFSSSKIFNGRLSDGDIVRLGDRDFEVIHSPGHTADSICLYCRREKVLFSGDTPLTITTPGGTYTDTFLLLLDRLAGLQVETIYPGHGVPITFATTHIQRSLRTVAQSRIIGTVSTDTDSTSYCRRFV